MVTRGWDDRWHAYPASKPISVEGGVVTSKQRGPMASTWWSKRFVAVLESYGLGARMQRGRRYARTGQVIDLEVGAGLVAAQVQGSRPKPYLVTVTLQEPTEEQWDRIASAMAAKVGFVARLLAGEVPEDLEEVFARSGVDLFPARWSDLRASCRCPDWENPCKHIAAVLYVFADRLDDDPWLVLALRGRRREEILETLGPATRSAASAGADTDEVAPWWPFAPGPLPALVDGEPLGAASERPDGVLDTLEALDVEIAGAPLVEILRPIYSRIAGEGPADLASHGPVEAT